RQIGGYETDRGTSCEDWELFVKLARAGRHIGVVPDHLFYYRQRPGGFSRTTNWFANHQRVMRQFGRPGRLEPGDSSVLWSALFALHALAFAAMEVVRPDIRDPEYGKRIERLKARVAEHPRRPVVVVLGSSRAAMGVRPQAWEELPHNESAPLLFNLARVGGG